MDSAQKALDALAVPPDRRWVPDTWCNDDGEWVARGPTRVNRMPAPILGESDDDYADRCLDADSSEPGCDGDQQAHDDAERMCLSVNLSAPLAAVVRAAMEYRVHLPTVDSTRGAGRYSDHAVKANAMHAALDAFNAAAQEMFP